MEIPELYLKIGVSVFILAFIWFMLAWDLPKKSFLRKTLKPFEKLVYFLSLEHTYSLFAPDPVSKNFMLGFELEYADGKVKSWESPHYYFKEDYQESDHNRSHYFRLALFRFHDRFTAGCSYLRLGVCRHIVEELKKEEQEGELPVKIHINQYYEPGEPAMRAITPWLNARVYTYDVSRDSELQQKPVNHGD